MLDGESEEEDVRTIDSVSPSEPAGLGRSEFEGALQRATRIVTPDKSAQKDEET
jgi:hypothetical protein